MVPRWHLLKKIKKTQSIPVVWALKQTKNHQINLWVTSCSCHVQQQQLSFTSIQSDILSMCLQYIYSCCRQDGPGRSAWCLAARSFQFSPLQVALVLLDSRKTPEDSVHWDETSFPLKLKRNNRDDVVKSNMFRNLLLKIRLIAKDLLRGLHRHRLPRCHVLIYQPRLFNVINWLRQLDTSRLREQQAQQAACDGHWADDDLGKGRPHLLQQQNERSHRYAQSSHEVAVAHSVLSGDTEAQSQPEAEILDKNLKLTKWCLQDTGHRMSQNKC